MYPLFDGSIPSVFKTYRICKLFNFLFFPCQKMPPPFPFARFGRRRGWILLCQCIIALSILAISANEPGTGLAAMAIAAAVGAFASATQDMSIDTWRIEVADEAAPVDLLSAMYQFGYRIAAFLGGAGSIGTRTARQK